MKPCNLSRKSGHTTGQRKWKENELQQTGTFMRENREEVKLEDDGAARAPGPAADADDGTFDTISLVDDAGTEAALSLFLPLSRNLFFVDRRKHPRSLKLLRCDMTLQM
ncbi:hypothetical protein OJAV_G00009430 [Oryzias javanicus]|uniref:Uncharacterized protein n=1 Tax=Oryzias javanicus TaxID=123683 RepID=A0A437DMX9_ORYJA|nr:hypothetical protein OJAV_G00009430 [Oryzias javanicus]